MYFVNTIFQKPFGITVLFYGKILLKEFYGKVAPASLNNIEVNFEGLLSVKEGDIAMNKVKSEGEIDRYRKREKKGRRRKRNRYQVRGLLRERDREISWDEVRRLK